MIDLRPGDNRKTLKRMAAEGEFVHSVVTDPPYGLVSVTKRFGKEGSAPAKFGKDGLYQRAVGGMMGKLWDGTGIERDPEFWRLVYDVMLPGAYIAAFSSSRTYGYMQVAMEAAGFITHPMLGWTFASGFPKAHNASRAIDKVLGVSGGRGSVKPGHEDFIGRDNMSALRESGALSSEGGFSRPWMHDPEAVENAHYSYEGGSEEARQWDGWSYGGQALKPALEPIYVGQKPFSEKNGALNILKHGVGALNIDGCRVPGVKDVPASPRRAAQRATYGDLSNDPGTGSGWNPNIGRWPANLLHDGSPEVLALFPDSKGQLAAASTDPDTRKNQNTYGEMKRGPDAGPPRGDSGSAARFFNCFPHDGPLLHYPKANKRDRAGSKHATVKPVGLIRHLQRLMTPPSGTTLDPFAGSGTSGQAALDEGFNAILMEAEHEYVLDIARRFDLDPGTAARLWAIGEAL